MAKDLRLRSMPIPADLTEDETKRLVAFAIDKGAQDPVTTGGRLVWHVDSHWIPMENLVLAELKRLRPDSSKPDVIRRARGQKCRLVLFVEQRLRWTASRSSAPRSAARTRSVRR